MAFIACGINHKTAPLAVREIVAQHDELRQKHLMQLLYLSGIEEAIILSTCNRTEIYCEAENSQVVTEWFLQKYQLQDTSQSYFFCYQGIEAVRHVLRVANGLDSMMLGEPQILGQMKQAYFEAEENNAVKKQLRDIFSFIFSTSKQIRHQSGISDNPISVASAAVRMIKQRFSDFSKLNVLIIGTGEISTLVTKYLQQQGVMSFAVASRTLKNATHLAQKLNAPSLTISEIPEQLAFADVVVSATACPFPFIHQQMIEQALTARQQQPMVILDLAVPRDVEPEVGTLSNVRLFNIDDLHQSIEESLHKRQKAACYAETLIDDALQTFIRKQQSLKANHVICDYRTQMQELAQTELERATQKLSNGQCHYQVLTEFCERLVNKLTHMPTLALKRAASENRDELLELAHYLFNASQGKLSHEKIS